MRSSKRHVYCIVETNINSSTSSSVSVPTTTTPCPGCGDVTTMLKVSSAQSQGHRDAIVSSLSVGQYVYVSDYC